MKKGMIALLIILMVIALVGCNNNEQPNEQEEQTGEQTQEQAQEQGEEGALKVGTSADFPPFEYIDTDGEIVGFDVDLVSEIAKELEMEVEIENITFDGLVDAVKTKKI